MPEKPAQIFDEPLNRRNHASARLNVKCGGTWVAIPAAVLHATAKGL